MFSIKLKFIATILILNLNLNNCDLRCDDAKTSDLIVNSLNGKLKGKCEETNIYYADKTKNKDVAILEWFGIPYAESPIGQLRLKKPIPVKSWSYTRNATKLPKQCVQLPNKNKNSEDCLFLNIYTPYNSYFKSVVQNNKNSLLPILIWIHGGSNVEGSGSEYDPSMISAQSNVITVTLNYRLGGLAYLYLSGTNATGNLVLYDQQLAIKWIYDNADKFGGDKNKITICGESAGSTHVGYHLLFKSSWPYFKNAILQSGNPVTDFGDHYTPKQADAITKKVAKTVGCNNKLSNQEILNCLQSLDAYYLIKSTVQTIQDFPQFPIIVYDKDLFVEQPMYLYQRGEFKQSGSILTGYDSFEQLSLASEEITSAQIKQLKSGDFASFKSILQDRLDVDDNQFAKVLKYYLNSSQMNNINEDYFYDYVVIVSDYEYRCPTHLFAEYISKFNKNMFVYLYAHRSSTSDYPAKFDGAAHADEIEYIFGEPLFDEDSYKSNEKLFAQQMINYWTTFVQYDKPSLNNEWPRYTETSSRNLFYLRMNQNKNTIFKTTDSICKFWSDLGVFSEN